MDMITATITAAIKARPRGDRTNITDRHPALPSSQARLIGRERVYSGPLLKIDRDRLELPGGKLADLETIKHPGAAAAIPFIDAETVILIRQYRHAAGGWMFEIPAGKLDPHELPERCAFREVEEETGWRAERLEPLGSILTTPGFTDEVIWLYEAHELSRAEQALEADELLEPITVEFGTALAMVRNGEIRDAKSVAALLHAAARRQGR